MIREKETSLRYQQCKLIVDNIESTYDDLLLTVNFKLVHIERNFFTTVLL